MNRPLPSIQDFLVVGIGASAGGLQALQTFFRHAPAAPDMAFVIVMHLSPTHEGNAAQLLQQCTAMPVVTVNAATLIATNTVYLLSPDVDLDMGGGYLRPGERSDKGAWPVAIDRFFSALAVAHQARAVGIVLSGSGSDGIAGLVALREHGGVVLVQDPEEAEFASMPRAAVAAGGADFVLRAGAMPATLDDIWQNARHIVLPVTPVLPATQASGSPAHGEEMTRLSDEDEAALRDVLTLLRSRTGHDFSRYKRATMLRRIERRLQVRQQRSLAAYRDLLREDRSESSALLRDMLIGVTRFFRDSEAFELLEKQLLPSLFEAAVPGLPLRVWSAGCSSGEETYSLAMLMAEQSARRPEAFDFQVFGSDIDERAIATARAGVYGASIAQEVTPARLAEHFNREDGGYRIKKAVRDRILFATQNLLRDPPFSKLDLISCRNMMIYLNRDMHEQVLEMFHFALNPGGLLFLGSSESAEVAAELFVPVCKKHRIYRARGTPRLASTSIPRSTPMVLPQAVPYPQRPASDKQPLAAVHQRVLAEYAPPSVLVDQQSNIVHLSEGTAQFLRHVAGEPSRNIIELVEPELRLELRSALFQANQSGKSVETRSSRCERAGRVFYVNMVARPFYDATLGADYVLILFHKFEQVAEPADADETDLAEVSVLSSLEQELQRTRLQLQDTIENSETSNEELKAANEELQAINEELRSATEELETGKEELQSVNEELITVNSELKSKVEETGKVNDDLQNLIASTDLATIFLDRGMRIKRFTPYALGLFNLMSGDIGRPLQDITHKLHYPELAADAVATFHTLLPVEREVASDDGRWFIARVLPYRTGLDQIDGAVLTFIDISGRRQAEERARAGEERMRLVAASTQDYAIITMDVDGMVTSFNSGAERIFGYSEAEILGLSDELIFTPEDRAAGMPADEKRRAREDGRAEDERWHLRKDGSRFYCSGVMTPLLDGNLSGYAKIGRDLTGQRQAEHGRAEQLEQARSRSDRAQSDNNQKDQFLAIMAHELKHPLNLIHMHADVLLRQATVRATPPLLNAVSAIRSSTISQAKIINDLLDLSRVSTGKLELNRIDLDLPQLVATIVAAMQETPNAPRLTLHVPSGLALRVHADEVRLEQVVWNLLSNAVKFTPPQGLVEVTLSGDGVLAQLEVRDTGQGIRAEVLPTIFEIFKQGNARNMRGISGLGIGLALVREIVQLHGGQVAAESDGPGCGACFTVVLPQVVGSARTAVEASEPEAVFQGLRVMLVDDNEDTLTVFGLLLEMEGAQVSRHASAPEALAALDLDCHDIVISDLNMPGMDGMAFITLLRAHPDCCAMPALALSGLGRQQDIDAALAAGFSGHINKPVDLADLARKVQSLLAAGSENRHG
ncbi:MAG: CheR family methyltransferase [Duganella sp.]